MDGRDIVERRNLFVTSRRSHPINRILARNVQSLDVEHVHTCPSLLSLAIISRDREREREEERTIIWRESGNLIERQRQRDAERHGWN